MLSLLPILTATLVQPMDSGFTIVSVERREVFAGRLGRRALVAERDGKKYTIRLGNTHTAVRGSVRTYNAGDEFTLDTGDFAKESN
jgi:hypothetical protein